MIIEGFSLFVFGEGNLYFPLENLDYVFFVLLSFGLFAISIFLIYKWLWWVIFYWNRDNVLISLVVLMIGIFFSPFSGWLVAVILRKLLANGVKKKRRTQKG